MGIIKARCMEMVSTSKMEGGGNSISLERRRVLEEARLCAVQLAASLSSFDQTVRAKLTKLDEKLSKAERSLLFQHGEKNPDQE